MGEVRNFLIAIFIALVVEAGVVWLTVKFVDIIWLRVLLIAIVPVIFLILAIRSDEE